MRIVLSIDVASDWAEPARWVLDQMLEVLGFDPCADPPGRGPFLLVHYGAAPARVPSGAAEVFIPAETEAPPGAYEPAVDFMNTRPQMPAAAGADPPGPVVEPIGFDLAAPAWFFLSRAEEERSGETERDELGRFRPDASWQIRRRVPAQPLVDLLGYWLLGAINRAAGRAGLAGLRKLPWPDGRRWAVALTHDQDQSVRWRRRIARRMFDVARGGRDGRAGAWSRLRRTVGEGPIRETIFADRLLEWEERAGIRSTFFFLPVKRDRFGRRYDVGSPPFRDLLRRLSEGGHCVALHASLGAASSADTLRAEREVIARALGGGVTGVRHHYLRLRLPRTWRLHEEAGLRWDASLGYPDHPGFRAGTSFPFRPPGAGRFLAFPLTGMDRALAVAGLDSEDRWEEWNEPTRRMGGLLDILWHPYFVDPELGEEREELFRTLLAWIASRSSTAWVTTLGEAAAWWDRRRAFRIADVAAAGERTTVRYRSGDAVRGVALSAVPAVSDMRIEGGAAGGAAIRREGKSLTAVAGPLGEGDEFAVTVEHRRPEEE